MKKLELAGAFTVLGLLVGSQLWSDAHGTMEMPSTETGADGLTVGVIAAVPPNMTLANLAVTGMT